MTPCLLRAGLLTAVADGLFSTVLSVFFYQSTAARLFQGVASTVIGPKAIDGGMTPALLGWAHGVRRLADRRVDRPRMTLS